MSNWIKKARRIPPQAAENMTETIHEKHLVSNFMVYWTSPSVIVPGGELKHSAFCCPVCKTRHPRPKHGVYTVCTANCGASWTALGNGLDLWYSNPEARDEPTEPDERSAGRLYWFLRKVTSSLPRFT